MKRQNRKLLSLFLIIGIVFSSVFYMALILFNKPLDTDKNESENRSSNVAITTKYFERRTIAAPVEAGNLFRLSAVEDGFVYLKKTESEFLKYQAVTDKNKSTNLDLYKFILDDNEDSQLMTGISQYHLSSNGKKLIYKAGSKFGVVDLGKASVGDGSLALKDVHIKRKQRKRGQSES